MEAVDRFINETYKGIEDWDQQMDLPDNVFSSGRSANPLQAPIRLR